MKFDEANKVIIETLNREEAQAFIKFLKSEIARHFRDIDDASNLIYDVRRKFKLSDMLDDN